MRDMSRQGSETLSEYKLGDSVYIESSPDQPFYICQVQEFKMSKGQRLIVHIKWFYRGVIQ